MGGAGELRDADSHAASVPLDDATGEQPPLIRRAEVVAFSLVGLLVICVVAVLYVGRLNVNEQMISDGHAWAFRRYLGQLDGDEHFCEIEAAARKGRRGLWSLPSARWVPPWIWRARQRASPCSKLPSRDYALETAQDCIAAIGKADAPPDITMPQGLLGHDGTLAEKAASADAGHPPGCDIKGNINSKGDRIYHLPGRSSYASTRINPESGERWFCSEDEARAAGWRAPR